MSGKAVPAVDCSLNISHETRRLLFSRLFVDLIDFYCLVVDILGFDWQNIVTQLISGRTRLFAAVRAVMRSNRRVRQLRKW